MERVSPDTCGHQNQRDILAVPERLSVEATQKEVSNEKGKD